MTREYKNDWVAKGYVPGIDLFVSNTPCKQGPDALVGFINITNAKLLETVRERLLRAGNTDNYRVVSVTPWSDNVPSIKLVLERVSDKAEIELNLFGNRLTVMVPQLLGISGLFKELRIPLGVNAYLHR